MDEAAHQEDAGKKDVAHMEADAGSAVTIAAKLVLEAVAGLAVEIGAMLAQEVVVSMAMAMGK